MIVKLLTERHLELLSLKGDCRGSSESTLVKMSNCWKSHALAHLLLVVQRESFCCGSIEFLEYEYLKGHENHLSQCMRFPTLWNFDMCRLR